MKKEKKYIAKLIINDLDSLKEIELDRLLGWLESKVTEVRDVYERLETLTASSEDPIYDKVYTSRLLK